MKPLLLERHRNDERARAESTRVREFFSKEMPRARNAGNFTGQGQRSRPHPALILREIHCRFDSNPMLRDIIGAAAARSVLGPGMNDYWRQIGETGETRCFYIMVSVGDLLDQAASWLIGT